MNLTLKFTQSYVNITKDGRNLYYFSKKAEPKSYLWFNVKDDQKVELIKTILDSNNFAYTYNKNNDFVFTLDKEYLTQHENIFKEIHKIRYTTSDESNGENSED